MNFGDLLAVFGVLFALFATLTGAYFATRVFGGRMLSLQRSVEAGKLSLIYRLPVGREQNLSVVQLGERCLLIGCTPQSISFITELTEEEYLRFVENRGGADSGTLGKFSQIFSRVEKEKDEGKE